MLTPDLIGPAMWTLWGGFNEVTEKRILSTILNISCLILLGFVWGYDFKYKEVFELSQEVDELESELKQFKNKENDYNKTSQEKL